jgi:hypothetical protein
MANLLRCRPWYGLFQGPGREVRGTQGFDRCFAHGEGRTGANSLAGKFSFKDRCDEVGLGAGVPVVTATSPCITRHILVAKLLELRLRRRGHCDVV